MKSKQLLVMIFAALVTNSIYAFAENSPSKTKPAKQTEKLRRFNATSKSTHQVDTSNLQELPPDTIQTIQLIGRSVLAAKNSEDIDSNMLQMKSSMQALQHSLDDVVKANLEFAPSEINVSDTVNPENIKSYSNGNKLNKPKADIELKQQKRQLRVGKKTDDLKQQLKNLRSENQLRRQSFNELDGNEKQLYRQNLTDKSQAILDEVDAALADNSPSRITKIIKLRDRLALKTVADIQPARITAEDTPTISTITRHRE